jgi:TPR repeat protein
MGTCQGLSAEQCFARALDFYRGKDGLAVDYGQARSLAQVACEMGDVEACGLRAQMVFRGHGAESDEARGLELAEEACQRDDIRSCVLAGYAYAEGKGARANLGKATQLYARACPDQGAESGPLCARRWFLERRLQPDGALALRPTMIALLQSECTQGRQESCFEHGRVLLLEGEREGAASLFDSACKAGLATACAALAYSSSDEEVRVQALMRSCNLGEATSCTTAGLEAVDDESALRWMRAACELKDSRGCFELWKRSGSSTDLD